MYNCQCMSKLFTKYHAGNKKYSLWKKSMSDFFSLKLFLRAQTNCLLLPSSWVTTHEYICLFYLVWLSFRIFFVPSTPLSKKETMIFLASSGSMFHNTVVSENGREIFSKHSWKKTKEIRLKSRKSCFFPYYPKTSKTTEQIGNRSKNITILAKF